MTPSKDWLDNIVNKAELPTPPPSLKDKIAASATCAKQKQPAFIIVRQAFKKPALALGLSLILGFYAGTTTNSNLNANFETQLYMGSGFLLARDIFDEEPRQ